MFRFPAGSLPVPDLSDVTVKEIKQNKRNPQPYDDYSTRWKMKRTTRTSAAK